MTLQQRQSFEELQHRLRLQVAKTESAPTSRPDVDDGHAEDSSSDDEAEVNIEPKITTLNDVFFPRIDVSKFCSPLRQLNSKLIQKVRSSKLIRTASSLSQDDTLSVTESSNTSTVSPRRNNERYALAGWVLNLSAVIDAFNSYLKDFGASDGSNPTSNTGDTVNGRESDGDDIERRPPLVATGAQSMLHLAHLINIVKGYLMANPNLQYASAVDAAQSVCTCHVLLCFEL